MWALQPALPDGASLPEALTRLAQRVSAEGPVAARATFTGAVRALGPELEVTLLRAVQEALANVQKHARASRALVTLSYLEDAVIVDIQDDGVGFEPGKLLAAPLRQTDGGYGLKALRERALQFGGTLDIESSPGAGTTIALTLPAPGSPSDTCSPARAEPEDG
jgi:signal transduction histidine kinase